MGDFIGTTISGMTGRGSIRHNNRSFSAANIDRSRTEQNVTYCNDDLKVDATRQDVRPFIFAEPQVKLA